LTLDADCGQAEATPLLGGTGFCYIDFDGGRTGRVGVEFFSGTTSTGTRHEPDVASRADKALFGASWRARWFGIKAGALPCNAYTFACPPLAAGATAAAARSMRPRRG
jgi:hypothetical protein